MRPTIWTVPQYLAAGLIVCGMLMVFNWLGIIG